MTANDPLLSIDEAAEPIRRVALATGEVEIKDLPCGSTRAAVCPSCAARARTLRAQQAAAHPPLP
jgi:hypothetical protein